MKLILDTNIYISALAFDAQIESLLKHILLINSWEILFSNDTFLELETKLDDQNLNKILAKSKRQVSALQRNIFLEQLRKSANFVEVGEVVDICRDPQDNKFLALAKTTSADFLITGDKDLLVLKLFENTKIATPAKFIQVNNIEFK